MVEETPSASVNTFLPNLLSGDVPIAPNPAAQSRVKCGCSALPGLIRPAAHALLLGLVAMAGSQAQTAGPAKRQPAGRPSSSKAPATKIAAVKSFRIIQEKTGPALEILATHPMIPAIQLIENPTRLVIDLPNARIDMTQKRMNVKSDQITAVRADQFQDNPPVARVVLDLQAPRTYTWDSAGNRLVVHLGMTTEPSHSPFQAPTVASLTPQPQPVVKSVRASGPLALAANAASVGSSFTAGADTAVITLSSGGELRVCPGTTLSITPSQNKHNLLLGMNSGALEAHLQLDASSDTVMTPDFRVLLVGPGEFHYAFSADSQGNTCVRALPGNTASAIVTELMGDRTYQVRATDQLVFRGGQLDRVDMNVPLECGCPPPRQVTERAASDSPPNATAEVAPPAMAQRMDSPQGEARMGSLPTGTPPQVPAATPVSNEMHVQISAPLVFRATGPPPAPVEDVRALPLDTRAHDLSTAALPPASAQSARAKGTGNSADNHPRGFFHKVGHFFASMFH
jgi:hypothetical protein